MSVDNGNSPGAPASRRIMKGDCGVMQVRAAGMRGLKSTLFGIVVLLAPATAWAQTPIAEAHVAAFATSVNVELVNRIPCFTPKTLTRFVIQHMRGASHQIFKSSRKGDAVRIRWVITALPDAEGTVRAIGSPGAGYRASPFWRHPIEIKIQLMEKAVVVHEISAKVAVRCDIRSVQLGRVVGELTSRLCASADRSDQSSNSACAR
jgi:hypothetical protein